MVRKSLILCLVIIIAASMILTGCGTKTNEGGDKTTTTAGTTVGTTAAAEIPEISLMNKDSRDYGMNDGTPIQKYLEDKFQVKFKIIRVPDEKKEEKVGLLAASGQLPDVIGSLGDYWTKLADQGVLGELNMEDFKKYAPYFYSELMNYNEVVKMDTMAYFRYNNKNYGIPTIWYQKPIYIRDWRMDMLKELGFTDVPKTLDDYEAIGAKLKAANSKAYLLGAADKDLFWQAFTDVYFAFGVPGPSGNNGFMIFKDGKITNSLLQPEMKDALAKLADWYKKGYIDPEFITDDQQVNINKFLNKKLISYAWDNIFQTDPETADNMYANAKKIDPNAEVVTAPWPKGPTGKAGWQMWNPVAGKKMFSKSMADDPVKMQKYYEMLDAFSQDVEVFYTLGKGIKGVNWDIDSDGSIKTLKQLSDADINEVGQTSCFYYAFTSDNATLKLRNEHPDQGSVKVYGYWNKVLAMYPDVFKPENMSFDVLITPIDEATNQKIANIYDIQTLIDKVIVGKIPVSQYDAEIQKWLSSGGQALLDYVNANDLKYYAK
ncbi:MAG: hypothetical protein FIA99_14360 [Ruminiclostridium sp.]|nr:hypothetical protein [Ruminiclostridium sp.]